MTQPSREFCECNHAAEDHLDVTHPETRGGPCLKCSCDRYSFDPYLETGPDGQPLNVLRAPAVEPDDETCPKCGEPNTWKGRTEEQRLCGSCRFGT